jgi:hypothetical protein
MTWPHLAHESDPPMPHVMLIALALVAAVASVAAQPATLNPGESGETTYFCIYDGDRSIQ